MRISGHIRLAGIRASSPPDGSPLPTSAVVAIAGDAFWTLCAEDMPLHVCGLCIRRLSLQR